jgi:DNA-binding transcriptional regulator YiaG
MNSHNDFSSYEKIHEWARANHVPLIRVAELLGLAPQSFYNLGMKKVFPKEITLQLKGLKAELARLAREMTGVADEKTRKVRTRKPRSRADAALDVEAVRRALGLWGISQVELACLVDASYDTVVSWCNGRRNVFKEEHVSLIRHLLTLGEKRQFTKADPNLEPAALPLRSFLADLGVKASGVSLRPTGTYRILGLENSRGNFALGHKDDQVLLRLRKRDFSVEIRCGRKNLHLSGVARTLRRSSQDVTGYFLADEAHRTIGVMTFLDRFGTVVLVGKSGPIRLLFAA